MRTLSYDRREKDFVIGSLLSTNKEIESTLAVCTSSASKRRNRKREPSEKSDSQSFFMLHPLSVARREEMIQTWKLFVKPSITTDD